MPRRFRGLSRRILYLPVDAFETISGHRRGLVPPRGLRWAGLGDYGAVGRDFRSILVERCGLARQSVVLDVGCGTGRLAVPLIDVLGSTGQYHGFDVWLPAIRWCTRRISRRHPNFNFQHVDVRNTEYNWSGSVNPAEFRFPHPDASFDVVIAVSLYTHLLAEAAARYATEVSRVLKPGGFCLQTFFLLNSEAEGLGAEGLGSYQFRHQCGDAIVSDPERPEAAVAFREEAVRAFFESVGLEVSNPVEYGAWCGRHSYRSFQDIVIAEKARNRVST